MCLKNRTKLWLPSRGRENRLGSCPAWAVASGKRCQAVRSSELQYRATKTIPGTWMFRWPGHIPKALWERWWSERLESPGKSGAPLLAPARRQRSERSWRIWGGWGCRGLAVSMWLGGSVVWWGTTAAGTQSCPVSSTLLCRAGWMHLHGRGRCGRTIVSDGGMLWDHTSDHVAATLSSSASQPRASTWRRQPFKVVSGLAPRVFSVTYIYTRCPCNVNQTFHLCTCMALKALPLWPGPAAKWQFLNSDFSEKAFKNGLSG